VSDSAVPDLIETLVAFDRIAKAKRLGSINL
jgi:hypothetical protein